MDPTRPENPLLHIEHPIAFDRIRPEQVRPAIDALLQEAQQRLDALDTATSAPSYENTLLELEEFGERLGRAMGVVGHLEAVATTPELREVYNEVQPRVSALPPMMTTVRATSLGAANRRPTSPDATTPRMLSP